MYIEMYVHPYDNLLLVGKLLSLLTEVTMLKSIQSTNNIKEYIPLFIVLHNRHALFFLTELQG